MSEIIPIASDHGGFELKESLRKELEKKGYDLKDYGTFSDESVDYPDFIRPLARDVNDGKYKRGIILCGSGNGAQMTANKFPKIRAALCWNKEITKLARQHNNANILSLPGRFLEPGPALEMALIFLETEFEGGRHTGRIDKIRI